MNNPALPSESLLQAQAEWLAPARARLLRRVGIARRRRILDLGAGYGAVTGELVRRGGGFVAAVDTSASSVAALSASSVTALLNSSALPLCGDALSLPFADESFDLVFCQCVLMWVTSTGSVTGSTGSGSGLVGLKTAVSEIHRVLEPNGVLIALEPDYAGMIEHPPEIATRDIWLSALARVGAEPRVGRMLPGLLATQGFEVRVDLLDSLVAPEAARFEFLRTLPPTDDEAAALEHAVIANANWGERWQKVVHLPFFLFTATKQ